MVRVLVGDGVGTFVNVGNPLALRDEVCVGAGVTVPVGGTGSEAVFDRVAVGGGVIVGDCVWLEVDGGESVVD